MVKIFGHPEYKKFNSNGIPRDRVHSSVKERFGFVASKMRWKVGYVRSGDMRRTVGYAE